MLCQYEYTMMTKPCRTYRPAERTDRRYGWKAVWDSYSSIAVWKPFGTRTPTLARLKSPFRMRTPTLARLRSRRNALQIGSRIPHARQSVRRNPKGSWRRAVRNAPYALASEVVSSLKAQRSGRKHRCEHSSAFARLAARPELKVVLCRTAVVLAIGMQ